MPIIKKPSADGSSITPRSWTCGFVLVWAARAPLPIGRAAGQHLRDVADARGRGAVELARAQRRNEVVLDDELGDRIGQRAFEAVADLDAHFAVVGRDQQQDAVVLGRLAQSPATEQLIGVVFDCAALQRSNGRDHDLIAIARFQRGELRRERLARLDTQHLRIVDDAPAQRRECLRRGGHREGEQCEESKEQTAPTNEALRPRSFSPLAGRRSG
jgi:hypothetical protein